MEQIRWDSNRQVDHTAQLHRDDPPPRRPTEAAPVQVTALRSKQIQRQRTGPEHAPPASRIAGRAGYWSWLLVALAVVAVAHRRLGPSLSTTTSTVDRALPSSAVQARCWSRPTTTDRHPGCVTFVGGRAADRR